jgi:uncharacterized protein (TIGR02271 family)
MDAKAPMGLQRLSQLDTYEVEAGYPDIRGWTLYDEADRNIGEVKDVLIDTARGVPVSLMIHLKDKNWFLELFQREENARVPLSAVALDETSRVVRLTRPLREVVSTRTDMPAAGTGLTTARDITGEAGQTVDVMEERVDVEKARKKAGEVKLKKDVETETVRRQVPVEREEVVVERERVDQPISAAEAGARFEGRGREILVPIYREEVEITKRPVITERLRIRKRSVPEQREVAAEVRKERARIEGEGAVREVGRAGEEIGETTRDTTPGKERPRRA